MAGMPASMQSNAFFYNEMRQEAMLKAVALAFKEKKYSVNRRRAWLFFMFAISM